MEFMESIGFKRGKSTPCVFWHEERQLRAVIHGDDFTLLGNELEGDWFRDNIQKRFEVKIRGRLGPDVNDDKSVRILNRIVTWKEDGIHYEADQRHAEIIVRQLGLKDSSNSLSTPGVKAAEDNERTLSDKEATMCRAIVARANYFICPKTGQAFNLR